MDLKAFDEFINTVEFDKTMAYYWAPESLTNAFFEQSNDSQIVYVENCIKALDKVYNGRGQDILRAAMILTENCNSFKNRINGIIKDEWLSEKIFGSIAPDCVIVMNTIPILEDWQVKLKELFAGMKWAEPPPMPEVKRDELDNISDNHQLIILDYLIQSYGIFDQKKSTMTMFTHSDIPLNEVIEVYNEFKAENLKLFQHVRWGVGGDGKFSLIYMTQDQNKKNTEQDEITKITI